MYVLPLRHESGRYIRPDVDERLELMAPGELQVLSVGGQRIG